MSDILLRAQVRVQTALSFLRRQEGQGLVEYGLIIASIAILLIVAMLFLGGRIDDLFSDTGACVDSPGNLGGQPECLED
jgi:pilus assembly protein Flp/PilA